MASLVFAVEGTVSALITVTEVGGDLVFNVQLTSDTGTIGDLRALFFDVNNEALLSGLSVTGVDVTDSAFGANTIKTLGGDANISGEVVNTFGAFDAGVEFGTAGMSANDIRSTQFILSHNTLDLTLDLISQQDFGVRITSVGTEGGSRNGSLKLGGEASAPPDAIDDGATTNEDDSVSGNVLANDTDADSNALTVIAVAGGSVGSPFAVTSSGGRIGQLIIAADGSFTFSPIGNFNGLAVGESDTITVSYTVSDDTGGSDTATLTITVDGTNDAPLITAEAGDSAGATVPETNSGLTANGTLTASDVDVSDLVSASVVGVTHSGPVGSLSDTDLLSYFQVTSGPLDTNATTSGQLTWNFNSGAEAFDFLAVGETLTLAYEIAATDNHGASDTQAVTIVISGADESLAPIQFGPRVSYIVGGHHASVAINDLNNDGNPDLVVTNAFLGSVSVLMGNGDGTFQPLGDYVTGDRPLSVAIVDFDGDGSVDLAVANADSDSVSILIGNGDGTFQNQVSYGTGQTPASVAIGDFNGDTELDLAVANQENGNSVSVLLGNGDGTFQTQTAYATGLSPNWVVANDLNGDSFLDLVTANGDASGVSVLIGNGDGTFANHVTYAAGSSQSSVALGDFDGDGDSDLAATNYLAATVSILLGNGDGTFQGPTTYAVGELPLSVAVSDLNLDGTLDLVVANSNSDTLSVLLGYGDGMFESQSELDSGVTPYTVSAGDLNGDGSPDLAIASYHYTAAVSVLLNDLL
jgi:VCBS repeat-containing protein